MESKDFLPVGSVVQLYNAKKRIVIMGILQVKHKENGEDVIYDYMGVPYPEGYVGERYGLLFNEEDIEKTLFVGFNDAERENFAEAIKDIVEKTDRVLDELKKENKN